MANKILIVEDEKKISRFVELQLVHEGYETDLAFDGREALFKIENNKYDLILLDIMIPKINGIEVCRKVRVFSDVPIIILTAKDEITDKIIGLNLGADDYVTKPFVTEELVARIRARLRKKENNLDMEIIEIGDVSINISKHEAKREGKILELSKTEFELLEYLVRNKGIVLSRDKILNKIWGYDYFGNDNILDVYMKYLRDKVDKPFKKKIIETVRGIGFTIK